MRKIRNVLVGSDHAGFRLKEKIKSCLIKKGLAVRDVGTYSEERCDYPEFAYKVAAAVSKDKRLRGILICKTGIGNSIAANRVPGARAALCYNIKAAKLSREHNDSNILVLGSSFVNAQLAEKISAVWLKTEFRAGRHKRRLDKIRNIERKIGCKIR